MSWTKINGLVNSLVNGLYFTDGLVYGRSSLRTGQRTAIKLLFSLDSVTQCLKWRESMKSQLRHKIQDFEYELYDRYDLYLRKWIARNNFLYNCWNCLINCKIQLLVYHLSAGPGMIAWLCCNKTVTVAMFWWRRFRVNNSIWILFLAAIISSAPDI